MARFDTVFNIDGNTQTITLASGGTIRAKSKHYFYAVFQFSDGTRDVDPFLTLENMSAVFSPVPFECNRGGVYIVPLPQSAPYECEIPWEVLTRKGKVYVGVFAGDMLVTNEAEINVTHAAPVLGADSQPTQSWWARFSAAIAELTAAIRGKQDILTAGENITITDNVISATGGAAIQPSSSAPLMDGAASAGTATTYARGDHRHPSDTTKQNVDYVIHVVNGVVTETPAAIAEAFADTSRRVVLDVDGFVYDRYLYIPEPSAGEPDLYLYWQPTISGTSSIMEVRGLYLSPAAATVSEQLYSTLLAEGDNVSSLVNDAGYLTEHQSLAAYRTAAAQDIIDQAQDTAIAAKYSKPSDGIPKSDLESDVRTSLGKADTALQTAPVSSVNGQTGAVTLAIPSSAADVGAIAAPASPSTGDTLVYNGSAWVAQNPTPEVTVSTAGAVTQALDAGKIYHFTGSVTALTITINAGTPAHYHFDFTEPSTAFDPTLPSGVKLPDNWTWEADMRYEVDILNNYAVVVGWEVR